MKVQIWYPEKLPICQSLGQPKEGKTWFNDNYMGNCKSADEECLANKLRNSAEMMLEAFSGAVSADETENEYSITRNIPV